MGYHKYVVQLLENVMKVRQTALSADHFNQVDLQLEPARFYD